MSYHSDTSDKKQNQKFNAQEDISFLFGIKVTKGHW